MEIWYIYIYHISHMSIDILLDLWNVFQIFTIYPLSNNNGKHMVYIW